MEFDSPLVRQGFHTWFPVFSHEYIEEPTTTCNVAAWVILFRPSLVTWALWIYRECTVVVETSFDGSLDRKIQQIISTGKKWVLGTRRRSISLWKASVPCITRCQPRVCKYVNMLIVFLKLKSWSLRSNRESGLLDLFCFTSDLPSSFQFYGAKINYLTKCDISRQSVYTYIPLSWVLRFSGRGRGGVLQQ